MPGEETVGKSGEAVVVVLGCSQTGKTTLVQRLLASEDLPEKYQPTVEEAYCQEYIARNHRCNLRIIDTAGSYTFPAMQRLWLHKATAFILVCSRNSQESLEHLGRLLRDIIAERGSKEVTQIPTVIVINKQDVDPLDWSFINDEVTEVMQKNAGQWRVPVLDTSALNNDGVLCVLESLWDQNLMNEDESRIHFQTMTQDNNKRKFGDSNGRRFSAFAILNTSWINHTGGNSPSSSNSGQESAGKRASTTSITSVNNTSDYFSRLDIKESNKSEPNKWSLKNRFLSQRVKKSKPYIRSPKNDPIRLECVIS